MTTYLIYVIFMASVAEITNGNWFSFRGLALLTAKIDRPYHIIILPALNQSGNHQYRTKTRENS
jgi:hypothetical protein